MATLTEPPGNPIQWRVQLADQLRSGRARRLRERVGMPRQELVDLLRVDYSTVWRWETGQGVPRDVRVIVRYVNALVAMESALAAVGIGPEDLDDGEQQPAGA